MTNLIAIRKKSAIAAFLGHSGSIFPSGSIAIEKIPTAGPGVFALNLGGSIAPGSDLSTASGGPSYQTIEQSLDGAYTPSGAVGSVVIPGTVDVQTELLDGLISPVGSLDGLIDPATVKLLQTILGQLAPTGTTLAEIVPTIATILKSIAGGITPGGALATLQGGPSYETKLKTTTGTITPGGGPTNVVIPPPVTFFAQAVAGSVTPAGALSSVKGGPSIVTIPKLVAGGVAPTGAVAGAVSGPSYETKPKSVTGMLTPHGTLTTLKGGQDLSTVTKAVAGNLSPLGSVSSSVASGTPQSTNPMYGSFGDRIVSEFDLTPNWKSILFSQVPSTVSGCVTTLDAMRARGMKGGFGAINPGSFGVKRADGTLDFSWSKYKAIIDMVASIPNIASYIADKTLEIFVCGDELQHPKWNGTIPPDMRKQMFQYAKQTIGNGIKIATRMPYQQLSGTQLPTGGWGGWLDFGWGQYVGPLHTSPKGLTPLQYYVQQRDGLAGLGVGLVCGANWWNGGDGSSGIQGPEGTSYWVMTPTEIIAAMNAAIQMVDSDYFMYWTDAVGNNLGGTAQMLTLQQSKPYDDAFKYARDAGLARGATNQPPTYYTDTNQHAAPYPPPSIAVGGALRDAMTDHKVFHLLDDGRLQLAEYPALNSDNSMLYFIRGGAGMIGDVTWSVSTSVVQVGNIRGAFGTGPFGYVDSVIWDRGDRRFAYFISSTAPAILYRRNMANGTSVVLKDFSTDPSFTAFWTAAGMVPTALSMYRIHASRSQERFVGVVLNGSTGVGVEVWDRLTGQVWNWRAPTGKTVFRTTIDDIGQYIKVFFTDQTWLIITLDVLGRYTQSAVLTDADPPARDDNQTNKMWQSGGLGVKRWPFSPATATGTLVYAHPKRSSKSDVYSRGRVSLQAVDEIAYESLFYAGALSNPVGGNKMYAGMFNWQVSEFGTSPGWVSSVYAPTPSSFLTDLGKAKSLGMKLFVNLAGAKSSWYDSTSSTNSLNNWKARVDRFRSINFSSYITDKTVCHYILDEPFVNGTVLPPSIIQQMINYSRSIWPTLDTTVRASAVYLVTNGWGGQPAPASWPGLTYGWSQYEGPLHVPGTNETPLQFFNREKTQLASKGLGIVCGGNWIDGGDGSSGVAGTFGTTRWMMTPQEIRACTDAALTITSSQFLIYWTHVYSTFSHPEYGPYEARADYQAEWKHAVDAGLARGTSSGSPWSLYNGEIYRLNWAAEQLVNPDKLAPEVVRQGITQLTKVSSLANLTARGQWFYDATANVLYVRCTDGLSPSTKRMVVFDWRFGMEEIVMVNTDGTLKGRLCRHFGFVSDFDVETEISRGASVSYDGSRVVFCSNWGGKSVIGIYAALTNPSL